MDTIFAEATAPGRAGVAIIRISGPQARNAAEILAGPLPQDSRTLRTLRDENGEVIDEALVLTFSAGRSFTGDDVVELHCHGSVAVLRTLLATLSTLPNLRFAEPGEFTRRALENGRLDLSQVEGLADLIDAETDLQRRQAVSVMTGALAAKVDGLRAMVIRAMALLEAAIDFVDEDVPTDVTPEVDGLLARLEADLTDEIDRSAAAERVRSGFEVAIVGAPNVGKSTLLNRLAGRRAALTSKTAGTTRDVIEVRMDLGGIPVTLIDTAGLRETDDELEKLGIDAGRDRAQKATLRLHLVESDGETQPSEGAIVRLAKDDFGRNGGISGETGFGVDELISEIRDRLKLQIPSGAVAIRARHRLAMEQAKDGIERARRLLSSGGDLEISAEELRNAVRNLDEIVGKVDVESLLDEIFRSFCIGK